MKSCELLLCPGRRALAAIAPLNSWIESFEKKHDLSVTLFPTVDKGSMAEAEKIEQWFKVVHPEIPIKRLGYPQRVGLNLSIVEDACRGRSEIYFLANPGMSHQAAWLAQRLPMETVCLSSDDRNLYSWRLSSDAKDAIKTIHKNIGFEIARLFPEGLLLEKVVSQSESFLSPAVSEALTASGGSLNFEWQLKVWERGAKPEKEDFMSLQVSKTLAWVTESKGRFYLLFDLTQELGSRSCEIGGSIPKALLAIYRAIVAKSQRMDKFVPLIITDFPNLIRRAKLDRVPVLNVDPSNSFEDLKRRVSAFIDGKNLPSPKTKIPTYMQSIDMTDVEGSTYLPNLAHVLFSSVGIDVVPTIKAILGTSADNIVLFFDKDAPSVVFATNRIRQMVIDKKRIISIPTDSLGTGIVDWISSRIQDLGPCEFNVTPGTKTFSIALAVAARISDRSHEVVSIDRNDIVRVDGGGVVGQSSAPPLSLIVECSLPPRMSIGDNSWDLPLWPALLRALVDRSVRSGPSLMGLRGPKKNSSGSKIKRWKGTRTDDGLYRVNIGKELIGEFNLPNEYFDVAQGGIWWEAVVMNALSKANFTDELYWQYKFRDPDVPARTGKFLSEIDVVGRRRESVFAVSCKARFTPKYGEWADALKAEITARFGRFAHSFIAVPYELDGRSDIPEGTTVLTPSILVNPNKVVAVFESHSKKLQKN